MAAFVLPELFSKNSQINITNTKKFLLKYQHLIKWRKNPSILEIGFGDGSNSRNSLWPILPKNYTEFVATDVSKKMLNFAKQQEMLPRSQFQQFDVACRKVPSSFHTRFDHIFSFFTMMYIKNPAQAFKNVSNMLKPDGETFHIFPLYLPMDKVYQKLSKHLKWGKYSQEIMMTPFSTESHPKRCFKKALDEAGFKNYFLEVEKVNYIFPNEEAWKGFFFSINATISHIPSEEIEDYRNDFLKEISELVLTYDENKENPTISLELCILSATK